MLTQKNLEIKASLLPVKLACALYLSVCCIEALGIIRSRKTHKKHLSGRAVQVAVLSCVYIFLSSWEQNLRLK